MSDDEMQAIDRPKTHVRREGTKARAARAIYDAMGPGRSLKKLREELRTLPEWQGHVPTQRRLEIWSASFSWVEKAKAYDVERTEERRIEREALKEQTNKEHFDLSSGAIATAVEQINRLIEAQKFGSQAVVQLLKLGIDTQRLALGLDKPDLSALNQQAGIQIVIETDNTPVVLPQLQQPRVVDADE